MAAKLIIDYLLSNYRDLSHPDQRYALMNDQEISSVIGLISYV